MEPSRQQAVRSDQNWWGCDSARSASFNAHYREVDRAVSYNTAAARAKGMPSVASPLNRCRSRTSAACRTVEASHCTISANALESTPT
jgi:hypothetical protein